MLSPCPSCRRHVAAADQTCPFCGTPVPRASARAPSKLTRAAIFASTALVAPACWTGNAKVADPPPNEIVTKHEADGTPVDSKTGTVVFVVVSNGSTPVSGRDVQLLGGDQPPRAAQTDARGVVTFANLPPGNYRYQTHDGHPRHSPSGGMVAVTAGQVARATINIYIPPYNPHATPMPYGAPPARRRLV